jgi:hypothetical protein
LLLLLLLDGAGSSSRAMGHGRQYGSVGQEAGQEPDVKGRVFVDVTTADH